MKINYQILLDQTLRGLKGRVPHLLLHSCCAPCSSYCLEYLTNYFDITVYYFNPNISPEAEYRLRAAEERRFLQEIPHAKEDFLTYVFGFLAILQVKIRLLEHHLSVLTDEPVDVNVFLHLLTTFQTNLFENKFQFFGNNFEKCASCFLHNSISANLAVSKNLIFNCR